MFKTGVNIDKLKL